MAEGRWSGVRPDADVVVLGGEPHPVAKPVTSQTAVGQPRPPHPAEYGEFLRAAVGVAVAQGSTAR
ncbi:hypothetical protein ACIBBE_30670 [Streptomyces sp. NPDC051644]|uniref:hypothetical protein n=1 Tax=Streptomyces sp. NPDC051644 TaxID=3365666 RepID=UPI00378FAF27